MTILWTIPRNGLVWEWLLDGNALDTSGSWNNGTAPGNNVTYTNTDRGYQRQTGVFNGTNAYISSTAINLQNTNKVSFGCWLYPTTAWFTMAQAVRVNAGAVQFFIANDANKVNWSIYWNDWTITEASEWSIPSNQWSFVFITYDGTSIKHYINNVLISTTAQTKSINTASSPIHYIGSNWSSLHFWSWRIQEARVYNRALSTQEIDALYKEGMRQLSGSSLAPLTDGLVAYYDFNGDANDIIGGNNGVVTGATLTTDRFSNTNRSYSFNGSSSNISTWTWLNTTLTSNAWSISIWFNATNLSDSNVFGKYLMAVDNSSGVRQFALGIGSTWSTNPWQFWFEKTSTGTQHGLWGTTITTGTWNFLTVTYNWTDLKSFINWWTQNTTSAMTPLASSTNSLNIWRRQYPSFEWYWNGSIWESLLFSRALSSSEVSALYQLSAAKYITPLLH